MKTKQIIIAVVAIIIIIAGVWYFQKPEPASGEPIKIGFIGPLSGDGAAWGEIERNTIQLAVDEINKEGGINGVSLDVYYEDGKCEGPTALSAAKKLVEIEDIKILLVSCSQEILPIAPYANEKKVIAFTSYASASDISEAGEFVFRNSYNNKDMAKSMASIAISKGKSAAIITEQSAFASDLRNLFVEEYVNMGGEIINNETFLQGQKDFRSQISKIVSSNPDVVIVNPNGPNTGIPLLQQIRQLGYKGPFVGNFFGGSKEVQEIPEAKGMIYVSDPILKKGSVKERVFSDYKKMFGEEPDLEWPVGARYDAVYILKQALEEVGSDPVKIKDYLHNMPKDFKGIIGTYRFESDSPDITNVQPSVAEIK